MLELIQNNNCGICILGDLNLDSFTQSGRKTAVDELLASFNIIRVSLPSTIPSIIVDCTDFDLDKVDVSVVESLLSDHTGQLCKI